VGFEPSISLFDRAKTVHGFNRSATVIGSPRIKQELLATKHILSYPYRTFLDNTAEDCSSETHSRSCQPIRAVEYVHVVVGMKHQRSAMICATE
jgi:hypothetical protein